MGFLDWLAGDLKAQPLSKEKLIDTYVEQFEKLSAKAGELTLPHLPTLYKKKRRLIKTDDYGMPCTDKWNDELDYFYQRVLQEELSDLETKPLPHGVTYDYFVVGATQLMIMSLKQIMLKTHCLSS